MWNWLHSSLCMSGSSLLFNLISLYSRGDQIGWLPVTYLLCNLLVLAVGVWAIASTENQDASQLVCTCTHNINQFELLHRYKPQPKKQINKITLLTETVLCATVNSYCCHVMHFFLPFHWPRAHHVTCK